ncbi:hypothetical protein [Streptomyces albidoflavus]|uniref:hypothetical protein n=1 Tax=Streptomyces albidoflavus TaxID=1886 RepID=UPI0033B6A5F4
MREMSDGAREILCITGEVARSRGAQEILTKDLAIAAVIYRRLTQDRSLEYEPGPQETTSPEMLPFGATLTQCLGAATETPIHVFELLDLAAEENPDLADYLR